MDASIDNDSPFRVTAPGRFTKVSVQTIAGEIEARLSEAGNWELRVRRDQETCWHMACSGDLSSGAVKAQPVVNEPLIRGPLTVDPESRRVIVGDSPVHLSRKEFALVALRSKSTSSARSTPAPTISSSAIPRPAGRSTPRS